MKRVPEILNRIADVVLAYKPKPRDKKKKKSTTKKKSVGQRR